MICIENFEASMDLHQIIMNEIYDKASETDSFPWEMEMDDVCTLALMIGNYNYQVENGGHKQYFDNGYASSTKGFGFAHKDVYRHEKLLELLEPIKEELVYGNEVYDIMYKFLKVFELDEEQYSEEDDEEIYNENYMCPTEDCLITWDNLDEDYYPLRDYFLKSFHEYLIKQATI